jgi:hypothetical protein
LGMTAMAPASATAARKWSASYAVSTRTKLGRSLSSRAAEAADGEVDLGAPSAARAAEGLISNPFYPGGMLVSADDGAVEDQVFKVRVLGHGGEDAMPDALGTPATEAAEGAVPMAEGVRQVAPGGAGADDPEHRLDEQAVVLARGAAATLIADNVWCHARPLGIIQD